MKNLYKQKREQGFTIIEVMIVLAIAAVILLIVLLAVPALQRNSRNTQRSNDAGQIAAAVNACLANQNSDITKCQSISTNNVDVDTAKLGQLTTKPVYSATAAGANAKTAVWTFGYYCDGNTPTSGAPGAKAFIVTYYVEASTGTIQRCVAS